MPDDGGGSSDGGDITAFAQEWNKFVLDFEMLERNHGDCMEKLKDVQRLQQENVKSVAQQRNRLAYFKEALKRLKETRGRKDPELVELLVDFADRRTRLEDIDQELPRSDNGLYLTTILGSPLNLSITSKNDKFAYKDEYEKFKITMSSICIVVLLVAYFFEFRVVDALAHFLFVAFYCTLTIRESVLTVNGSRIKGWWVTHHYLSAVCTGITITWPDGACYQAFRTQFVIFCLYTSVVQLLQCQYQRGCLRRLRALGQRHLMDITVDGFHSWMFKGLTFLLPFLVLGYVFELFNAYTLFKIWLTIGCEGQWQVLAMSVLFFIICIGNSFTTWQVCWRKFGSQHKISNVLRLQTKYSTVALHTNKEELRQSFTAMAAADKDK